MKKITRCWIFALAMFPALSSAAAFDFTNVGTGMNNTPLPVQVTDGTVQATGLIYNGGASYTRATLWLRNETNDHGLGVCDHEDINCEAAGGNVNELDNLLVREAIRLEKPDNEVWESLWVSSLDGTEMGTVFWSNEAAPDLGGLPSFSFQSPAFGGSAVEGDLFPIGLGALIDPTARFLFFIAGDLNIPNGDDNDYLVWKGTTAVIPVPAALWLFGSGLIGLVGFARRSKS